MSLKSYEGLTLNNLQGYLTTTYDLDLGFFQRESSFWHKTQLLTNRTGSGLEKSKNRSSLLYSILGRSENRVLYFICHSSGICHFFVYKHDSKQKNFYVQWFLCANILCGQALVSFLPKKTTFWL